MVLILCWSILGILGMLMATWAYAQDKSSSRNVIDRTFTVGHILIGAVTGPLFFALGLYYALSVTPIMEYVDKLLSLPLFTWRGKDM